MMRDERAVSTALGYVLALGISALLISGLLVASGGFVTDQRERAARTELRVLGQQVAGDLSRADQLRRTGSDTNVTLTRRLPETVAGEHYLVRIETDPNPETYVLILNSSDTETSVTVHVRSETDIAAPVVFDPGTIRIVYDSADDQLEVRDGDA